MSKITGKNLFFIKDLKSGAIISMNVRGGKEEIEKQNRDLRKKGQEHLIRFEVVSEPEEKKAGRPKKENK